MHTHTKWAKSPKDFLPCGVFGWLCPSPVCVLNGHLFSQSVSPIVQSGSIHITAQLWSRMAKAHRTDRHERSEMGVGRESGFRETEQHGSLVSVSTVWLLTSRRESGWEADGFMHSQLWGGSSPFLVWSFKTKTVSQLNLDSLRNLLFAHKLLFHRSGDLKH